MGTDAAPACDSGPAALTGWLAPHALQFAGGIALLGGIALCLNLSTVQIAWLSLLLPLGVLCALQPTWFWRRGVKASAAVLLAMCGLLAAALLSHLATPVGSSGGAAALRAVAWLAVFPLTVTLVLGGARLRRALLWAVLLGACLAGCIGVVQHFTGIHPGAELLGVAESQRQIVSPSDPARFAAVGLFYNRTRFAHVMVVGICLGLGLALDARRHWHRIIATLLVLPPIAALLLSYTRAAALALGLALLIMTVPTLRRRPRVALSALLGLLLVIGVVLVVPSLRERAASAVNLVANADRLFIWERALAMLADFGGTGIGFAQHGYAHPYYLDSVNSHFGQRAQSHNLYLSFLVEMGAVGLLALLALLLGVARHAKRASVDAGDDRAVRRGAGMALVALAVLSLFHDPLYQAIEALAFILGPALLASLPLPQPIPSTKRTDESDRRLWLRRVAVVAASVLAAIGLAIYATPQLVMVVALTTVLTVLWPSWSVTRLAHAGVLALALSVVALQGGPPLLVAATLVMLLLLASCRRCDGTVLLYGAGAVLAVAVPWAAVRFASHSEAASLELIARISIALLTASALFARRELGREGRITAIGIGAVAVLALVWRVAMPAPAPGPNQVASHAALRTWSVQMARIGQRQQVALTLRDRVCWDLAVAPETGCAGNAALGLSSCAPFVYESGGASVAGRAGLARR